MSSAPDSSKMPYELSAEEARIFVSPMLGVGEEPPSSRKWLKRWILASAELLRYDGKGSFILHGFRPPFDAQVPIRRELPPDVHGKMPRVIGDFAVRGTVFMVTEVPSGAPPEDASRLPEMVSALLDLDGEFRGGWGDKPFPQGISRASGDLGNFCKIAERLPNLANRASMIAEALSQWPFERLDRYPHGLIHGDPGIDNCTLDSERIIFSDGPLEVAPELVDVAYFLQSAGAYLEDFTVEPVITALADRYSADEGDIRRDLILADAMAHLSAIRLFDDIAVQIAPDFADLYDHLIEERVSALETITQYERK